MQHLPEGATAVPVFDAPRKTRALLRALKRLPGCESARLIWRTRGGAMLSADLSRLRRPPEIHATSTVELICGGEDDRGSGDASASLPDALRVVFRKLRKPPNLAFRRGSNGSVQISFAWPSWS